MVVIAGEKLVETVAADGNIGRDGPDCPRKGAPLLDLELIGKRVSIGLEGWIWMASTCACGG